MPGISSVLELARYQVGESAWWVTLRLKEPINPLKEDQHWMIEAHPKLLYERGPYKKNWTYRSKLPKLQHLDFQGIVGLLTSDLVVERFDICDVIRSQDTGEFFYSNEDDEWMPESCLFDTITAARRERARIMRMLKKWIQD